MISLERLNLDEINGKQLYLKQLEDLYGEDLDGTFYKYIFNGQVRWLYCSKGLCTIIGDDGEYIVYTSFCVSDDGTLQYMEFDNFYASESNGEMLTWQDGSPVCEGLSTMKLTYPNDGYTGLIFHHQINCNTNEELLVSYRNMYREDGHVFACNLNKPFIICFIKGKKVIRYFNFDIERDSYYYDLVTIREYGLNRYLEEGPLALQRKSIINRYYKILHQFGDGSCLMGIPIVKGMTNEEMEQMIKDKGFNLGVSSYLIDFYNKDFEECDEYYLLVQALKDVGYLDTDEKKLVKGCDKNGNNTL